MPVLRLRQIAEGENRYRVLVELEQDGARRTAESRIGFYLTAGHNRGSIRYWEAATDFSDLHN